MSDKRTLFLGPPVPFESSSGMPDKKTRSTERGVPLSTTSNDNVSPTGTPLQCFFLVGMHRRYPVMFCQERNKPQRLSPTGDNMWRRKGAEPVWLVMFLTGCYRVSADPFLSPTTKNRKGGSCCVSFHVVTRFPFLVVGEKNGLIATTVIHWTATSNNAINRRSWLSG